MWTTLRIVACLSTVTWGGYASAGDVADYLTKDGKLRATLMVSQRCEAPGQDEIAWVIEPAGDWRVVLLKRDGTEGDVLRKGKLDARQVAALAQHLATLEFDALPEEFGDNHPEFVPLRQQVRLGKKVCTYNNPEHRKLRDGPSDFVANRRIAAWSRFALAVTFVEDLLRGDKPDR